jgi:hypothetical protein
VPAMHRSCLGDNQEMSRARSACECPACKQTPKEDESGRLTCACGTPWVRCWGVKGTPEEEALLEPSGFRVAEGVQGDVYYVGPYGHIIRLYAGGEWDSDKAPREQSLEDYLSWITEKLAALGERP